MKRLRLFRAGIACLVLTVTVVLLMSEGLSVTSGLVQVSTFVVGVLAWVMVGRSSAGAGESTAAAERVSSRSGGVRIEQSASTNVARRIRAGEDIDIRQRRDT